MDARAHRLIIALLACGIAVTAGAVEVKNGIVLLPNDDTIAPFNRPFNLTGKSLTFTPAESGSFREETGPLQFDEDRGTTLVLDSATKSATYTISGFDFPFFGEAVRTLHISQLLAIYLDPVPAPYPFSFPQYGDAELVAATDRRVIAPLLTSVRGQGTFRPPSVSVKETSNAVTITWWEQTRGLAIQAVLFADGAIRFSYRNIANTRGGAVIITSGRETWRTAVRIADTTDPPNDIPSSATPDIDAMLDITSVSLSRIGNTNVLQATIGTRGALDRTKLSGSVAVAVQLGFGAQTFLHANFAAEASRDSLMLPSWVAIGPTPAMRVEDNTITITFAQEHLFTELDGEVELALFTGTTAGDQARFSARVDRPQQPLRTDFGAAPSVASFAGPITDAFTIPRFDIDAAWERVRIALQLEPAEIDAVAFYENFYTDSVFSSGAYATQGNAGVDGITMAPTPPSSKPRSPNLMQMGTIRHGFNNIDAFAMQVLMHELGHRWGFGVQVLEGDGKVTALADSSGHPLPGLDTRAAFPVRHSFDCSVMGGFTFVDHGDGTFSGAGVQEDDCNYGYSWLDLYVMGLAAAEEVPDFFYLTNPDRPIDFLSLYEGPIRATRRNLTIANVIARLGARKPSWPDTQRVFRMLFVLLHDPELPLPEADVDNVAHLARLMKETFAVATGHRGSIDTVFSVPSKRRRAARH